MPLAYQFLCECCLQALLSAKEKVLGLSVSQRFVLRGLIQRQVRTALVPLTEDIIHVIHTHRKNIGVWDL